MLTDPAETGAVVLSLPEDVQTEAYDWPADFFEPRIWRVRRPPPEPELIRQAADLLSAAERPLIVAGGGVIYSEAERALAELARRFGIPVVESQAGKGALAWNHPQNAGPVGSIGGSAANRLARDADVVLAVGTRLGDFVTASKTAFQHPEVKFIGLNVVAMDAAKLGALSIVADAREGITALGEALADWRGLPDEQRAGHRTLIAEWHALVDEQRADTGSSPPSQGAVIGVVNEATGTRYHRHLRGGKLAGRSAAAVATHDSKAYHVEYGFSCMGYEIPAGLGVELAEPGRRVVVMVGDGSYLMMNSEIVTAVMENLNLTIVLIDNRAYMSIRGLQMDCGTAAL